MTVTPPPAGIEERRDDRGINMLTFGMIVLINLIARPFNAVHGARHDISLSEWRCIVWLAAFPGASGQATANGIGLDRMSVSRNLRSLEAKGRVTRAEDQQDKKRWQWRLSDSGWEIYDILLPGALERDVNITKTLSPSERATVIRFLENAAGSLAESDSTDKV